MTGLLPHSFLGSSDRSLQSLTESQTLELSMHSPFLHRNFRGPSHLVAAEGKGKERQEHLYVRQPAGLLQINCGAFGGIWSPAECLE